MNAVAIERANAAQWRERSPASSRTWLVTTANSTAVRYREQQRDHARGDVRVLAPPLEQLGVAGVVRDVDAGDGQKKRDAEQDGAAAAIRAVRRGFEVETWSWDS